MNAPITPARCSQSVERLAGQSPGTLLAEAPEQLPHSPNLDRLAHAWLGRTTAGLSPASLIAAYQDLAAHLAISPATQLELVEKAWRKVHRLILTPGLRACANAHGAVDERGDAL